MTASGSHAPADDPLPAPAHPAQQRELILLCRQLGAMLAANADILRALLIVRDQISSPLLQSALETAHNDMTMGSTLATSFRRYPQLFSLFFIDMVRQGEGEGALGEVLQSLADTLEKELRIDLEMGMMSIRFPGAGQRGGAGGGTIGRPEAVFRLAVWLGLGLVAASCVGWGISASGHLVAGVAAALTVTGVAAAAWGMIELRQQPATATDAVDEPKEPVLDHRPPPAVPSSGRDDIHRDPVTAIYSLPDTLRTPRKPAAAAQNPELPPQTNSAPPRVPGDRRQMPL